MKMQWTLCADGIERKLPVPPKQKLTADERYNLRERQNEAQAESMTYGGGGEYEPSQDE
jgi:hypothetical protein